jgi:hypothetical protein
MKYMIAAAVAAVAAFTVSSGPAFAEDSFHADADAALKKLYENEPVAKMIGEKAKAVLVFRVADKGQGHRPL